MENENKEIYVTGIDANDTRYKRKFASLDAAYLWLSVTNLTGFTLYSRLPSYFSSEEFTEVE